MRSLLFRLADDMRKMSMISPFREDPWAFYRMASPWSDLYRIPNTQDLPKIGKEGYQVSMNVAQYKPNELTVKVVDNDTVVVEGKIENREDEHGFLSKHFVRSFTLPKGFLADSAITSLSSDGVLTVSVPKAADADKTNERVLPIQQTGPAALNVKENPAVDSGASSSDAKDKK